MNIGNTSANMFFLVCILCLAHGLFTYSYQLLVEGDGVDYFYMAQYIRSNLMHAQGYAFFLSPIIYIDNKIFSGQGYFIHYET